MPTHRHLHIHEVSSNRRIRAYIYMNAKTLRITIFKYENDYNNGIFTLSTIVRSASMNKLFLTVLGLALVILAGCGNGEKTGLEGKSLGLSSQDPTVSKKEAESADIKFSSSMMVFDFESADEVTLTQNGNSYPGTYTLEDTDLNIEVEDGDSSLKILFTEFEETPGEYYSYTGAIESSELDDSEDTTQLININNNLSSNMPYIFLEEN